MSWGKHRSDPSKDNRPYILVHGVVVTEGTSVTDQHLTVAFDDGGHHTLFQGGSGRANLFCGAARVTDARTWCSDQLNKRQVQTYAAPNSATGSFICKGTPRGALPGWNTPENKSWQARCNTALSYFGRCGFRKRQCFIRVYLRSMDPVNVSEF